MAVADRIVNGAADGVAATTTNTTFDQVTVGTGGFIRWYNSAGRNGNTGLAFDVGTSANLMRDAIVSDMRQRVGTWFRVRSWPTGTATRMMFGLRHSGGFAISFHIHSDGRMFVQNSANGDNTFVLDAGAIVLNEWYFVETDSTVATSTTGATTVRVYDRFGTQVGSTLTKTGANYGTNPITTLQASGGSTAWGFDLYGMRSEEGAGSPITPYGGFDSTATAVTANGVLTASGIGQVYIDKRQAFKNILALAPTNSVRMAGLGSSTMAGANATPSAMRFLNKLGDMWRASVGAGGDTQALAGGSPTSNGLLIRNGGVGGANSATYLDSTRLSYITALDPMLAMHCIGSNDRVNGTPPATYKTNMQAAIDAVDAAAPNPVFHIVIHSFPRMDAGGTYPWSEYGTALEQLGEENANVWVLNIAYTYETVWGVPGADPFNIIDTDNIHQNNDGHDIMARLLYGMTLGFPADGVATATGTAAVSTAAVVTADGVLTVSGTAISSAAMVTNANGTLTASGTAATVQREIRTADGSATASGTATAVARGVVTANGTLTASGSAQVFEREITTANGTLTASGSADAQAAGGAASRTANGTLTASGTAEAFARIAVTATGTVTAIGTAVAEVVGGTAVRTAVGVLTASGTATASAREFRTANGTATATGSALSGAIYAVIAQGILTVSGVGNVTPPAGWPVFPSIRTVSVVTPARVVSLSDKRGVSSG